MSAVETVSIKIKVFRDFPQISNYANLIFVIRWYCSFNCRITSKLQTALVTRIQLFREQLPSSTRLINSTKFPSL